MKRSSGIRRERRRPVARNKYDIDEELSKEFDAQAVFRMLRYLRPYRKTVLTAVFLMVVASLVSLLGPYLAKVAIDDCIPNKDVGLLCALAAILAAAQAVNALCLKIRIKAMNDIGQGVIRSIRTDVFEKLQKLPFTYFDSRPHGKILIRVVNYVNSLSDLLSNGIINLISDLFSLAFIIVFMLIIDARLTLICMAGLPILAVAVLSLKRRQRAAWQDMSRKQSNLNAYLHEALSGVKITQSFARAEENQRIFSRLGGMWRESWLRAVGLFLLIWPVIEIISVLGVSLVYVSGVAWLKGITVGVLVAFIGYVWRFWTPITTIGNFYSSLVQAAAYLERIFETIDEDPGIADAPGAKDLPRVEGRVEFRDVSFSYERGRPILRHMSFAAEPGSSVAIVGPTGAGKTTIVNLLSRFYLSDSGTISIDGHDIRDVTLRSLRTQTGVMLQDSFLFSGTIRDNIRYGRLDASDGEIIEAARTVQAHDFISTLSAGYDTSVNERGIRLSMGQRQLVSFARALLADPAILILDEATSSVDTETERAIRKGLARLLKGRTSFVIAHRLSTIRNADTILFVDRGRIIEEGSHEELSAKRGAYYALYASMRGFD
jgi:ATP-binding cassette subfamily B multidrug efflux pump